MFQFFKQSKKYIHELHHSSEANRSLWGPEFEFYIFDNVAFDNGVNHAIPPKDQLYNLPTEISLHLEAMGVAVNYHHYEVGGPGQCEIKTPMMELVAVGDAATLVKYVAKMTAHSHDKTVTFMPKPLYGEAGSGMHFHQHLSLER